MSTAHAQEVEAALDRDSVPAGQGAMLTIQISGGRAAEPSIPAVKDLIVQPRGRSQNVQIVNGTTTMSVTYNYAVGSTIPGDYQIPSFEVVVDGRKFPTQPLNLKVVPDVSNVPPAGLPPAAPGTQGEQRENTASEQETGFLTVELAASERKHVYVGEIAPVRIRAWLPADSQPQLRSGIQPEAKAFTLHNVSGQPQQSMEVKDGKRYIVATWYGGISATKAGKYPASLSLNATVAIRDESAPKPRRPRGGPFDDPFFDSAFDRMNARYIQKDVTLSSLDQEIEVRPLPTAGRPQGFTGAVGDFKLEAADFPTEWNSGEPRQLIAGISGAGNFALMNAPDLTPPENWKTYPAKDEFTANDEASFSGTKRFQFSAVPKKGGEQEVGLTFSYFDPAAGEYKTLNSPLVKIRVAGEDMIEKEEIAIAEPTPEPKLEDTLVGQKTVVSAVGLLDPLVARPAFVSLLAVAGGLSLLGGLLAVFRKRWQDPKRRARIAMEAATRGALHAAGERAAARDVPGFFAAARRAIQERLGAQWNQPAQAITLAEVAERMPGDSPVLEFFREADLHEYSRSAAGEMFPRWQELLDQAMQSLTPSAR
ncbi:MAG: BatD family protein [Akkermansiaceae bacterium]